MEHESVQMMFDRMAGRLPDNIAITSPDRSITYGDLRKKSDNLANFLASSGAIKGSLIAILAEDKVESIAAILASLKAGCAYVPCDPHIPEKRLETLLAEIEPRWLVIEARFIPKLSAIGRAADGQLNVICVDSAELPPDQDGITYLRDYASYWNPTKPDVTSRPDDMCYVYFTSGSTGRPKGIAGRLKGIDHFIRWEINNLGLGEGARVSQLLPLSFDGSIRDIFYPLCSGGTVCVPGKEETVLDASKLIRWIDDEQINVIHCVPSLFRSILAADLGPDHFARLKYILMAGEALLPSDVERWMQVFGERVQLVNLYGTSETTMAKFAYFINRDDINRRSVPIGKPIEGAQALLINKTGRQCQPGMIGEIFIKTPYRSHGYYNQPDLTSEVFVQNPLTDDPDDIVYKTGDVGRILEDGNYEYLGRRDQQVKIRGSRVELTEVEAVLSKLDIINEVAVIDREDASGFKYLCAYVVLKEGSGMAEVRDYVENYLPDYMVPSAMVLMDELPRTISGKVDRKALPAPGDANQGQEEEYAAPTDPIEEQVAAIWGQVLGLERVGIHHNFFRLGGHSLMATQLLSRVRKTFNVEIPLRNLFESPTVAGVASLIISKQQNMEFMQTETITRFEQVDEDAFLAKLDQLSDDEVDSMLNVLAGAEVAE